jgi:glycosyltransferase involved in cell wall biosynthesis
MNILVINWQDITNPSAGGAEVHFQEIFKRIVHLGHRVTLCCCSFPGALQRETIDGIEIVRYGGRGTFNAHVPFAYRSLQQERSFDIVVEDLNKLPFFTPLYVRQPLVGIAHHLFGRSIFLEIGPFSASYVYGMERLALALYRKRVPFMVVSASTEREFIRLGFPSDRLAIIPNCVDHARYTPGDHKKNPTPLFGYFGRLKRYKSIDQFLRALPTVLARYPSVETVIAGEGDDRERLERLSEDLGLANSVRFTGRLSETEKVELLRRLWFTVSTSAKEGWGLTVLEANACGTPSIASDVPGLRDAVQNNVTGLLFPYGDVSALSSRLLLLLENAALRTRLSSQAFTWARTFSWDVTAEKTINFLEREIENHRTAKSLNAANASEAESDRRGTDRGMKHHG